jgi:hypothetical protein
VWQAVSKFSELKDLVGTDSRMPEVAAALAATAEDMRQIGLLAREQMLRRVGRGVDVHGQAFQPYSPGYAAGEAPRRRRRLGVNLQVSGGMLNDLTVVSAEATGQGERDAGVEQVMAKRPSFSDAFRPIPTRRTSARVTKAPKIRARKPRSLRRALKDGVGGLTTENAIAATRGRSFSAVATSVASRRRCGTTSPAPASRTSCANSSGLSDDEQNAMSGRVINWTYGESDPGLMLWTASVQRWGLQWPCEKPRILELGCAETDWLERMQAQNPEITLTGVDVHPCTRPMTMTGSGFDPDLFAPASFDVVVMLGALEHFGLGFYGDPIDDDGDTKTMQNIVRWLAPGGWVYFDVPCQPTSIAENRHFRTYAPADVQAV